MVWTWPVPDVFRHLFEHVFVKLVRRRYCDFLFRLTTFWGTLHNLPEPYYTDSIIAEDAETSTIEPMKSDSKDTKCV